MKINGVATSPFEQACVEGGPQCIVTPWLCSSSQNHRSVWAFQATFDFGAELAVVSQILGIVVAVTVATASLKYVVCRRGREGVSGSKHPDALLLGERWSLSHRPKGDLLVGGFQVQLVAWLQVQFLAQSLRDYDTAGAV